MDPSFDKVYIKPDEAVKKLRAARSTNQTVYVYGAIGYGKTELIRQFFGRKKYYYFSCLDRKQKRFMIPSIESGERKADIVVIDDCHFLKEEEKQQDVLNLMKDKQIWLIIIGRNNIPSWLRQEYLYTGFTIISEKDLSLKAKDIKEFLLRYDQVVDDDALQKLFLWSEDGNAFFIKLIAVKMAEGYQCDEELYQQIKYNFMQFLDQALFTQWDPTIVEFLMQVSVVDEFNIKQAEMITGHHDVAELLEQICELDNFMFMNNGMYRMRPFLLDTIRVKAKKTYGEEGLGLFLYNAGLYFEMQDDLLQAAELYHRSGSKQRIREILIRNARKHPGAGHYYQLRKYYFELKEEEVENSAVLMSALSMLYSMILQPEKSEYWYSKLEKYEKTLIGTEKREAISQLIYLDIALIQRDIGDIIRIVKKIPNFLFDNDIKLPEFCVTSNLPSTMNGGKDFCEWSKHDKELAATIGKLLAKCLGKYGKGLVNAALGESLYEKGEDTYEIITYLNRGQMEAESGGKIEIAFACVGIQVRLNLVHGNEEEALNILTAFEKKAKESGIDQLLSNLQAIKCRIALYGGDVEVIEDWMAEAPNEAEEFFAMERYRYLTKVRCYLFQAKYMEAYALLEKIQYYAELYERQYIIMEVGILRAIAQYRLGTSEWQDTLLDTLKKVNEYRFIRIISEEGTAIYELLEQGKKVWMECEELDKEWLKTVMKEAGKMAIRYPVYMKGQVSNRLDFSENALSVLRLQADGYSINEIAKALDMKVETVRYHSKQNYKKLGVSGKADAVLTARNLKLL